MLLIETVKDENIFFRNINFLEIYREDWRTARSKGTIRGFCMRPKIRHCEFGLEKQIMGIENQA